MDQMDREQDLGRAADLVIDLDPAYRDRLLLVDEMEETAQAIRARAVGFDDVADEQVQRLESALEALRADLGRRGGAAMESPGR